MLQDQNFVKRLAACEIMGGANNICSDKTGTLTKNEMTVTTFWSGDVKDLKVNDVKYNFSDYFKNQKISQLLSEAISCNTIGTIEESSATEMAMLKMINKFGVDFEGMRKKHLTGDVCRFQFTSKRKKMSTVLRNVEGCEIPTDQRLHTKGAAEIVLATCSHYLDSEGNKQVMTDEMKSSLLEVIENFARGALRTICMAYKDVQPNEGGPEHEEQDEKGHFVIEKNNNTCIAILGIRDIIRPEVPDAVRKCQGAGV